MADATAPIDDDDDPPVTYVGLPPLYDTGCGSLLLFLLLMFGGLGLMMFGLLLAGMSAGPGTPDPVLISAGLLAAALGIVGMVFARLLGNRCPKCAALGGRKPRVPEPAWPAEPPDGGGRIRYYSCRSCGHEWREGPDLPGDDPEYEAAVRESEAEDDAARSERDRP
ncbi:MAG: hypothetical protein ACOYOB_02115 [Myxococcota bacterium]